MINFKAFIHAIHGAILEANNTLMNRNQDVLNQYFEATNYSGEDEKEKEKTILKPKTVSLEYPHVDADGNLQLTEILVPLITLAPLNLSQIDKVTLTSEFEMKINGKELEIEFSDRKSTGFLRKNRDTKLGKIEIVIKPQDSSEGIKILVEAYENALKRQL
jgi:hypothetical protein